MVTSTYICGLPCTLSEGLRWLECRRSCVRYWGCFNKSVSVIEENGFLSSPTVESATLPTPCYIGYRCWRSSLRSWRLQRGVQRMRQSRWPLGEYPATYKPSRRYLPCTRFYDNIQLQAFHFSLSYRTNPTIYISLSISLCLPVLERRVQISIS